MTSEPDRPALPVGWFHPEDAATTSSLEDELRRELPPGHLLFGRAVDIVAHRHGTDDILVRHRDRPQRFTVVHLSWIGKQEIDARHPTVEFDGTLEGFLAEEKRLYGLSPEP